MQPERRLIPLSEVRERPLRWLWPNRLPLEAISLLDGDPGQGKSCVIYDLAARVTRGKPMPNCTGHSEPAGVVLLQAEDNLQSTVLPRLKAAGADINRIYAFDPASFHADPFILPKDLLLLEKAAADVRAKLVVLDPLAAFLGSSTASDVAVRKTLGPLAAFAERAGLAILAVRHLTKGGSAKALYRGTGSIALIGAARSALLVTDDPGWEDPYRHLLVQTKTNLSRATSLIYRTEKQGDVIRVEWLGESRRTAQDLLGSTGGHIPSRRSEAMQVIYSILSEGPVPSNEAIARASKASIHGNTLYRAKADLGVKSRKWGSGRGSWWTWELPKDEELLRPFKEKDLDDLMDRLFNEGDEPPKSGAYPPA